MHKYVKKQSILQKTPRNKTVLNHSLYFRVNLFGVIENKPVQFSNYLSINPSADAFCIPVGPFHIAFPVSANLLFAAGGARSNYILFVVEFHFLGLHAIILFFHSVFLLKTFNFIYIYKLKNYISPCFGQ